MMRSHCPVPAGVRGAALATALALAPTIALAASASGNFSLSGSRVHVYNLAGAVEVVAGSGSSVTVQSTSGGRDAARLDVQILPGGEPALVFKYPGTKVIYRRGHSEHGSSRTTIDVGGDGRFGAGRGMNGVGAGKRKVEIRTDGSGLEAWADLKIAIPPGQKTAVHLGMGAVTVANVEGELLIDCAATGIKAAGTRGALYIETGSGAIEVHDAAGFVSIDTGSGSVSVNDFTGSDLVVDTGSGAVRLASVRADARVNVDTGSGRVEIIDVNTPRVGVDTGSGSVYVRLAGTPRDISVDTGSGAVTVEAPPTLDAIVRLESGSGGLEVDFPMQSVSRDDDHVSGTIGKGTGRIVLETGSGRIRLIRL